MSARADIRAAAERLRLLQQDEKRLRAAHAHQRQLADKAATTAAMYEQALRTHHQRRATAQALGEVFNAEAPVAPPPGAVAEHVATVGGLALRVADNAAAQDGMRHALTTLRVRLASEMYEHQARRYAELVAPLTEALAACTALGVIAKRPVNTLRTYLPAVDGGIRSAATDGSVISHLSLHAELRSAPDTVAGQLMAFERLFAALQVPEPPPDEADLRPVEVGEAA